MIAIIDYKAGNQTSVRLALESLSASAEITDRKDTILSADRVIFPGVGAAGSAMRRISESGLIETIHEVINRGIPFLGICLGSQIVLERSEEDGGTDCIGLVAGTVKRFRPSGGKDKIPHMGWNSVELLRVHPVFAGIENNSEFYFVHSYYPVPENTDCVLGRTNYSDIEFASVIASGNLVATQFHPEKSGRIGLHVLENFCRWSGKC
ncbi:MAG: imidazole glycerol phosphate synthase subunit HisH [Lentisphaerae bacterium]|nr:imidazole glycerol phosphate synthase subunit HisH [Lentisphaerota bacterium]